MSKRKLNNARVILTGASSGIGRALALELGKYGCRMVLCARREERLKELAEELLSVMPGGATEENAQKIQLVVGDLTNDTTRQDAVDKAKNVFGGLDILINNAGVGAFGLFENAAPDRLLQILDVNLVSSVEMTRLALPLLLESGADTSSTKTRPIIVFTSSIMGKVGAPYSSEYSAAKCGIQGFSQALRAELKSKNIDVLTVSPGTTKTEFFDSVIEKTGMAKWPSHTPVSPQYVARRVINAIKKGTHELVPYFWGEVLCVINRFSPRLVDYIMSRYV